MRIAICTDQYLPLLSGVADSVDILANQLRLGGHQVRVYTLSLPHAGPDANVMRFPSYVSKGGIALVFPFGAMKDICAFRPEVIHTHMAGIVGLFAAYAAWRLHVPLVGTDHTLIDYYYPKPLRPVAKKFSSWYYNRCAAVTAPSSAMLTELKDYGLYKPSQVISNHVPTHIFRPIFDKETLKKKYNIPPRAVLVFGRIAVEKNIDVAIEVFARLAKEADAHLVFVGDGPYRAAAREKINAQGLAGRTQFLGTLRGEALVEAINACEVYLMTSLSENQSMTMIQTMACGVPVIIANAGGVPEYIENGVTGYVVEPDNIDAFVACATKMLNSPELAKRIGEAGRESVLPYSPENIAALFEALYTAVLSKR